MAMKSALASRWKWTMAGSYTWRVGPAPANGTWTFGSGPDSWGDWQLLLNGNEVGIGLEMEVDNGGQLYMADVTGPSDWWIWQNNSWSPSSDPHGSGAVNGQC